VQIDVTIGEHEVEQRLDVLVQGLDRARVLAGHLQVDLDLSAQRGQDVRVTDMQPLQLARLLWFKRAWE
jgi:hypothetical protein